MAGGGQQSDLGSPCPPQLLSALLGHNPTTTGGHCPLPRSWEKRRVTFKFTIASKEEPGGGGEGECGTAGLKEGAASE